MARLNEPPVTSESIDSLKRRFVRQNRDLARCNSQQSIKIRALETDLHHCLSENAALRTRILALETELADTRTLDIRSGVANLRNRLTSQFASIVAELTELERKPRRRKSQLHLPVSPKRSPQQREWRNTSTLGEVLASQGATLPTIVEGKRFPRRTMDVVDVQRLIDDADVDSPEIGPPPRTFLDQEQAITNDARLASPKSQSPEEGTDSKGLFDAVEIRRRRRSSKVHSEDATVASIELAHPIKAGAKRKMDFVEGRETSQAVPSPRKVLGDKSVNTDPVVTSPVKPQQSARATKKPIVARTAPSRPPSRPSEKDKPPARPSSRTARAPSAPQLDTSTTISIKPPKADPITRPDAPEPIIPQPEPVKIKTEPKTPHPLDLFSPVSSQPSAPDLPPTRPATPPPSNILTATTSATSASDVAAGGRGSRRGGRPAVSYAEPKINVKMRRPGKEMADAVVAGAGAGLKREGCSGSREPENGGVDVKVKAEEVYEDTKKDDLVTASPLDNRTKPQPSQVRLQSDPQQLLDIFEVVGTPPPPAAAAASKTRASLPLAPSRTDRSNTAAAGSTVRPLSRTASVDTAGKTSAASATTRKDRRQTVSTTATAPPTSEVSLTSSNTSSSSSPPAPREVRVRSSNVRRMSSVGSVRTGLEATEKSGDQGAVNVRAERAGRIAERRRSMML